MSDTAVGLLGLGALFVLFVLRMPVGLSMLITGFLGTVAIRGWTHALPSLSSETFAIASFYQLSIIPMFVLMGNIAGASGMGRDLYDAAYAWVGHIRGGLASATVIACACFASLCGSAAASAVTMGRVALPEMRRFKYDDALRPAPSPPAARWVSSFRPVPALSSMACSRSRRSGVCFSPASFPGSSSRCCSSRPSGSSRRSARRPVLPARAPGRASGSGPSSSRSASSPSSS